MDQEKQTRETISKHFLRSIEGDPGFLDNVIDGDETWFFEYNPKQNGKAAVAQSTIAALKEGFKIRNQSNVACSL